MTYLHSSVETPMRAALKHMLREFDATHTLTLAFHEQINMSRATAKISRWHRNTMHRLFGRRCFQISVSQTIEFLLLPEAGCANLHFHGLIRIPPTHFAYFERLALQGWKRVAHKGTIHFQPLRPTAEERDAWFTYITKSELAKEILLSSMLTESFTRPDWQQPDTAPIPAFKWINPVLSEARHEPVRTSAKKVNGIH
jgi:hypothetical protein